VLVVGVIACGPNPNLIVLDTHLAGQNALVEASGNPDAIQKLFRGSVVDGGLWFNDAACAAQFSNGGELRPDQLAAFAHCLAGLHLQPSTRDDALGDVVVMTYAPGIEIEARVVQEDVGPHLTWIGYESRRDIDALIPTVTVDTLESIRLSGDRNGPLDPSVASTLELDPTPKSHAQFTWLRLCVDETGAVTLAHPFETTSEQASAAFETAAKAWTFRPFTIQGRVVPICSMVRMTYPAGQGPTVETLPLPPKPLRARKEPIVFAEGAKNAKLTEGRRIAGSKFIAPDNDTKSAIQKKTAGRVTGSFRLCLDETGHVDSVLPLRSTGFAAYDRKIIGGIYTWRYSPYLVNDQPVPVCTAITFIYSQR
jgi:hypothetical protein